MPGGRRPDDLREIAERFGEVRDVYIPRNYHTQQPRGFAFIEFQDARACEDASYDMQGIEIEGRPVRPPWLLPPSGTGLLGALLPANHASCAAQ